MIARTRCGTKRTKSHLTTTGRTNTSAKQLRRYTLTLRVVHQRELEAKVKFLQSVILRERVCVCVCVCVRACVCVRLCIRMGYADHTAAPAHAVALEPSA